MSASFTNQVLAQLELHNRAEAYDKQVYMLPKELDEEVARLHLDHLRVQLTTLTDDQADVPRRVAGRALQARPLPLLGAASPGRSARCREASAAALRRRCAQNGGSGAGPTIVGTMCAVVVVIRNRVFRSAPSPQQRLPQTSGVSTMPMRSPVGRQHPDAARAGDPDVAELVALHAVAVARSGGTPVPTPSAMRRARPERAVRRRRRRP